MGVNIPDFRAGTKRRPTRQLAPWRPLGGIFLLGLLALGSAPSFPAEGVATAPALQAELTDLGGRTHTLEDYRGRIVLVNFWASWCSACITEFPSLERLSRAMYGRPFALLAVNVNEGLGVAGRFRGLEASGIKILRDRGGRLAEAWGVRVYPTSILLGADGGEVERFVGGMDWDSAELHGPIESLLDAMAD
jgi:thiol-disulfide isomerase/thioredoxin